MEKVLRPHQKIAPLAASNFQIQKRRRNRNKTDDDSRWTRQNYQRVSRATEGKLGEVYAVGRKEDESGS